MWKYDDVTSVHVELSTLCNAACGSCIRFVEIGSRKIVPGLKQTYISLDDFKKFFPKEFSQRITNWTFCGSYGDPMTNPDVLKIITYVLDCNPHTHIQLNTNAGMKMPSFWTELGNLLVDRDAVVIFSVDGLEDTNHLYRRNVSWNKVISAMTAYLSTGARATWDYLVFKHNEHQIEDAKLLADELGIVISFKSPIGFEKDVIEMLDDNDDLEYVIEKSKEYDLRWK